ncbi:DUF5785 family protein [Halococcoides cellulosivorans]|uniref:Uncharacterized protein n=1 Tax=Halococcoides cellulosivorans TaxID=1679096 RepID=A0A2R4X0Z8_9EURY|nr:DUF5785 family protein [Halococcoides cellulosivorans]AWB27455.1 hypothetical protein HARCEL1_06915 [Halococcoides cellulosivorans]
MDWPHDPDGDEGSEGRRKYGHAVLVKTVDEDEFPLAIPAYLDEYGDYPVRIDADRVVSVAEIFEGVDATEIDDIQSYHQIVGDAMRANGQWGLDRDAA